MVAFWFSYIMCMETTRFSQDQEMGTGFTLPPVTTKKWTKYRELCILLQNIRHQMKDSE